VQDDPLSPHSAIGPEPYSGNYFDAGSNADRRPVNTLLTP
jgi:hypothetical protein